MVSQTMSDAGGGPSIEGRYGVLMSGGRYVGAVRATLLTQMNGRQGFQENDAGRAHFARLVSDQPGDNVRLVVQISDQDRSVQHQFHAGVFFRWAIERVSPLSRGPQPFLMATSYIVCACFLGAGFLTVDFIGAASGFDLARGAGLSAQLSRFIAMVSPDDQRRTARSCLSNTDSILARSLKSAKSGP